jgi:hypothetical protein
MLQDSDSASKVSNASPLHYTYIVQGLCKVRSPLRWTQACRELDERVGSELVES